MRSVQNPIVQTISRIVLTALLLSTGVAHSADGEAPTPPMAPALNATTPPQTADGATADRHVFTPDQVYKIAQRSAGEARATGYDGVGLVACTIANRYTLGYGDLDAVLEAYYAPDWTPTEQEIAAVNDWLIRCPAKIVYAFSYSDTVYLQFPRGQADAIASSDAETTYFYEKWLGCKPWAGGC